MYFRLSVHSSNSTCVLFIDVRRHSVGLLCKHSMREAVSTDVGFVLPRSTNYVYYPWVCNGVAFVSVEISVLPCHRHSLNNNVNNPFSETDAIYTETVAVRIVCAIKVYGISCSNIVCVRFECTKVYGIRSYRNLFARVGLVI